MSGLDRGQQVLAAAPDQVTAPILILAERFAVVGGVGIEQQPGVVADQ